MLTVLQSRLGQGERIKDFSYRNLAPLYAEEEMRVCLRKDGTDRGASEERYDVWIEGKAGGYSVKGSATIRRLENALIFK
jgi:hydroxyacyl-ACP dehydratase HTD2-like protein with hotdog domain